MWKPNATVAAVIERDGKFLLVEERILGARKLNQPAGHVEQGESIVAACVRETFEETAHHAVPTALVGIYQWSPPERPELTYLRFAFAADVTGFDASAQLDDGIEAAVWLSRDEIVARSAEHRSPLLLACIDDYLAGKRYPLALLRDFDAATREAAP
ncbi:ADP-ribose pyrophosphatase YjhB, NUDIX family [Andreprevotia lacus DSM 23236]|jgi:8-oxo-dGTP pyrophosphatase MutT (NUDIX family)|uniref:Phosphatase NudJ n=1 Tax=Andreprevotia lacus DSM 23236 TaxID=1121001 RepID=A0A1W1WWJ7_9NEIS|nr:NUDIX hydrolase [Andreprevotia lacus]SMC15940.1 ADP-ribose pyrophosphatase YjhB, NUDIX family [Andreprevotia lacus DSM 23236]